MTSGLITETKVAINHQAVPYVIEGQPGEPAFLLLHGLTASPTEVQPLANFLHQQFPNASISCPLLPGHGTTPQLLHAINHDAWISVAQTELQHMNNLGNRVVVIGVSMGAVLAAHVAASHAGVQSLVMLSPMFSLKRSLKICLPWLRFLVPYKAKSQASIDNHKVKGLFSYDCYPTRSLLELQKLADLTLAQLGAIECPVLLATGKLDRYINISALHQVRNRLTATSITDVSCDRSGHVLPHEPDAKMLFEKIHAHILNSLESQDQIRR